ncbi:hypothetical protein RSPO_c00532 [Ralstonia solanacearum Po82]|uniref:Uncharacterized protein n=1 Tax=Ralstonia solanacearum (strain Po82) TaxID=1031711 RepID=F6FXV3_RALS8|nr:hypothetical protein RSPO_c00532 [Ralstonia solanacearum Po82]
MPSAYAVGQTAAAMRPAAAATMAGRAHAMKMFPLDVVSLM